MVIMIQSHLLAKSQYLNHSTVSFDLFVSQCERLLIEKFERNKYDVNRKHIKIGKVSRTFNDLFIYIKFL